MAVPATTVVMQIPATYKNPRRTAPASRRQRIHSGAVSSKKNMSAAVATNDIWKLALHIDSGRRTRMTSAAIAMVRMENALRSSITATSTRPVISNARYDGTLGTASPV